MPRALVVIAVLAAGCTQSIDDMDDVFFRWDGERSLCGVGLDERLGNGVGDIRRGLDRARERSEVLITYTHRPGATIEIATLETIVQEVVAADLEFVTFADLSSDPADARPGFALTFDDAAVEAWDEAIDMLSAYDVRATFFVTRFAELEPEQLEILRELDAAGHAIEAHGVDHVDAVDYVDRFGLDRYIDEQVVPALDAMRAEGFSPRAFAYPFGYHTGDIDRAVLEHVDYVRSLSWTAGYPVLTDPC